MRGAARAGAAVAIISVSIAAVPAGAHVVCVDPGHGGTDPGAIGTCDEKDLNLAVSNALLYLLQHDPDFEGSFATRTGDVTLTLADRVAAAEAGGADAFVSLHHNSGTTLRTFVEYDTTSEQASLWTYSQDLAASAAAKLCESFSSPHGLVCDGACLDQEPRCSGSALYVLRNNARPAALGEPCGVATDEAARLCSTAVYPDVAEEAHGYHEGLRQFFGLTAIGTSLTASGGPGADTLRWTESDPERWVAYALARGDACWGPFEPIASIVSHDARYTEEGIHYTYVDRGVSYARLYWYRISVAGEEAEAASTPWALPPASPPPAPEGLVANGFARGDGRAAVSLSWEPEAADGYYIYRSLYQNMPDCGAAYDLIATSAGAAYTDTTAPVSVPLFYRVRAFNVTGGSDVSGEAALAVSATAGAPDGATSPPWPWPNPAPRGASLRVPIPSAGRVRASLHDAAGRRVAMLLDAWRPAGVLDLSIAAARGPGSRLPSGVYFLRILLDDRPFGTRRMVLLR